MPYYRSNRRRPNYGKKRLMKTSYGGQTKKLVDGKGTSYVKMGIQAIPYILRSVKLLKSLINTEAKYVDVSSSATFSSTMVYERLTAIAVGTTDITRIGNKILLKDVLVRLRFIMNSSATATQCRWILFVDKECDGAIPSAPQPLASSSTEAPNSMDFSKRYVIVKTGNVSLSINGTRDFAIKCYKNLNIHCDYDGTGSAVADAKENQLYIGFISSEATNVPTYSLYSRVKYYDS